MYSFANFCQGPTACHMLLQMPEVEKWTRQRKWRKQWASMVWTFVIAVRAQRREVSILAEGLGSKNFTSKFLRLGLEDTLMLARKTGREKEKWRGKRKPSSFQGLSMQVGDRIFREESYKYHTHTLLHQYLSSALKSEALVQWECYFFKNLEKKRYLMTA